MGQEEVYELLKKLRLQGDDFYKRHELEVMLRQAGNGNGVCHSITKDLVQLDKTGYLDVSTYWNGRLLDWQKQVRLKLKYVKGKKSE